MNSASVNWEGILVNWFPMFLLIGVWMFFLIRMRGKGFNHLQTRNVEALERIATALEKMARN